LKIIIASTGRDMNSDVSPIFGRSSDFIIIEIDDEEIKETKFIENPAKNEKSAGSLAANYLADNNVEALITGKLGRVALHVLKTAGIKVYRARPGTVEVNLKSFQEDKLHEITNLQGGF
jgi:predicted Fe-Mo cluster-binding NifX family protein